MKKASKIVASATLIALIISACGSSGGVGGPSSPDENIIAQDGCTPVIVATSSEKVNLMEELGALFSESPEHEALGECATIYPINVASGDATRILSSNPDSWPELPEDYWPTVWSPASTIWTDRVAAAGNPQLVQGAESFTKTPIVYGVPESMAKALDYPNTPLSLKKIGELVQDPEGWGSVGKPLWGDFKIAKTNPNTSTTGLSAILMQSYSAAGKTDNLEVADVTAAEEFSKAFELGAIHYGDTTGKVLKTLYQASMSGEQGSSYVSAIALEETSLINYNKGNPDSHTVQPGETLTPPKEKLIAVYPEEGSMWSDNPAVVLGSSWVTPEQKTAGDAFVKFLHTETAQKVLPEYGFRPLLDTIDASSVLNATLGVDVKQPVASLPKPSEDVVSAALDQWTKVRKPSSVLELIDISGSMDEGTGDGRTKLEGAIEGAKATLGNFRGTDNVGVWAFTTSISSDHGENVVPLRELSPLKGDKETLSSDLDDLTNARLGGTPLYDSISTAYDYMMEQAETGRINAIVVLSDGSDTDSSVSLDSLLVKLNGTKKEGAQGPSVRIFTIAYGSGADTGILERIAKASGGQMFDATDPTRINQVFASVINNF